MNQPATPENRSRGTNALREATGRSSTKAQNVGQYLTAPDTLAQLSRIVPATMNPDRLLRIALTEIRKTPKLAQCNVQSFAAALMKCGQLGLEPGGAQGHVYLIPFEKRRKVGGQWKTVDVECQVIPGYQGLAELARRSGKVEAIMPRAVMRGDVFSVEFGLEESITHRPSFEVDRNNPANLIAVYCVARLAGGGVQFDVMGVHEINAIRDGSSGYQTAMRDAERNNREPDSPWVKHYIPMALKTVVRRLCKFLPSSPELALAVALDERADAGQDQASATIIDGQFIEVPDDPPGADDDDQRDTGADETTGQDRETKRDAGATKDADPATNGAKRETSKPADGTPPAEGEALTHAQVSGAIRAAKSIDELAEAAALGARVKDPVHRKELADFAAERWRKLSPADDGQPTTNTQGK